MTAAPTHRIVIGSIYPLGYKLDRVLFERAAYEAIAADPALLHWSGEAEAIREILAHIPDADESTRTKYQAMLPTALAGELVAHRLMPTEAVQTLIASEEVDPIEDRIEFAVRVKCGTPLTEISA